VAYSKRAAKEGARAEQNWQPVTIFDIPEEKSQHTAVLSYPRRSAMKVG